MTKPKILTASFWTDRVDALTDNVGRSVRTGLQMAGLALVQAPTLDWFEVDVARLAAVFAAGAVSSFLTSFITPPPPKES